MAQPIALPTDRTLSPADRKVFEDLCSRHYRQAYHIAYRMTGSHANAEDLTQEAMVRAYQSFHRYRRELPFANWLYRIIVNLHIDELRRRPKAWGGAGGGGAGGGGRPGGGGGPAGRGL